MNLKEDCKAPKANQANEAISNTINALSGIKCLHGNPTSEHNQLNHKIFFDDYEKFHDAVISCVNCPAFTMGKQASFFVECDVNFVCRW